MALKPMLQIALDTSDLNEALRATRLVRDVVDIIEAGTILCLAEGLGAVKTIKTLYPDKLVLADVRVAEAGALISKMVFDAGADWISVLSSASLPTVESVAKEAFLRGGDVQIELQDGWSLEKLNACKELGIRQVIFHKSRDAEKLISGWSQEFLDLIRLMCDRGYLVSITGNLTVNDLAIFKGVPIYSFVAGRAIRDADNPREAAQAFKNAILQTWQ
ncbi:MAG: orotidine 5'-phosphate decarboxylase [Anaerolineaceae bacterium]|nr:orotidine 5'-phosphate decarboxylase [Anaerolineaceae bacterium]